MKRILLILLIMITFCNYASAQEKIAVLMESKYTHKDLVLITNFFQDNGYQVDLLSHLWNQPQLTFKAQDKDASVTVAIEINDVEPTDYAGIIFITGYAMERLRYEEKPQKGQPNMSPAVKFMRKAFADNILTGAVCHGLMLLTVDPSFLRGRTVTAAHNIIYDVINAGGIIVYEDAGGTRDVVVDGNLVTGRHQDDLNEFLKVFLQTLKKRKRSKNTTLKRLQ